MLVVVCVQGQLDVHQVFVVVVILVYLYFNFFYFGKSLYLKLFLFRDLVNLMKTAIAFTSGISA